MKTVKLRIQIDSGNDAFQDDPKAQLQECIRQAAAAVTHYAGANHRLLDFNGNTCGHVEFSITEDGE